MQDLAANEMLFYKDLRQDLKDIRGHLYYSTTDVDVLRVKIRIIETEHSVQSRSKPKPAKVKSGISQANSIGTFVT